jgi:hypothetical protein
MITNSMDLLTTSYQVIKSVIKFSESNKCPTKKLNKNLSNCKIAKIKIILISLIIITKIVNTVILVKENKTMRRKGCSKNI